MNSEERVLFEQFCYIVGPNGGEIDEKYLPFIINIILNSKSFHNKQLLTLSVKTLSENLDSFSFYGTYFDEKTLENSDIIGTITIKEGNIYLVANIHNFNNQENRDEEIVEVFKKRDSKISIFSSYKNQDSFFERKIKLNEFDKASEFIFNTVNLIKQKKRG